MDQAMNGILIVFEGIDGAGKTTQARLLAESLTAAGEAVVTSKEPTNGKWGTIVRESAKTGRLSLAEELHAFVEDRKEHIRTTIQPALEAGRVVILDRYYYSTVAYQGARGANIDGVFDDMRAMAPIPDIVFLLDADPLVTLNRISHQRGETPNQFERPDALADVRRIFLQLAARDSRIKILDAHMGIEDVYRALIETLVAGVLKAKRCAKAYDCDVFYCIPRQFGECRWSNTRHSLLTDSRHRLS